MKNSALVVIDWAVGNEMYVVYIQHNNLAAGTRTFKVGTHGAELVPEMKVVSDHIFTKTKSNALTSEDFTSYDKKKLPEMLDYYESKGCSVKKLSEII